MAIHRLYLVCDYCGKTAEEYEYEEEAHEDGWWFVNGPHLETNGADLAYCSLECLESDLL